MNKLALVLVLISFSGNNVLAANLPASGRVEPVVGMSMRDGEQDELISNRATIEHSPIGFAPAPVPEGRSKGGRR